MTRPHTLLKTILFLLLLSLPAWSRAPFEAVQESIRALYAQGGYRNAAEDPAPSLQATAMALRTFRYLGIELQDTRAQQAFLLSRFDPEHAAFVEHGAGEPGVLPNAFALMVMSELGMPEDVHTISARDYLMQHASGFDEMYMATAGLNSMGLCNEVPADWLKTMMDAGLREDSPGTPYEKARALITCLRMGITLNDYSPFHSLLEKALKDAAADPAFHEDPEKLQHAYTLARALMMMEGRVNLTLPDIDAVARQHPPLARLYRLATLRAWEPKLQGKLHVAICTGFAPVGFRDGSGEIAGFDADLMRAFAQEHGYELIFEEQIRFAGIWELPARGLSDLAVSGLSKRRERMRPGIRWSYPYFNVERSLSILKSNGDRFRSIADFDGMKIAVTAGTTGDQDVRERNPDAIRVPYDSEEAAIQDLLVGKVHALARGDVSNRYDARLQPELTVIDVHPMVPVEEFVVAVSSERVALAQKLDQFLRESRKNGALDRILEKYLKE